MKLNQLSLAAMLVSLAIVRADEAIPSFPKPVAQAQVLALSPAERVDAVKWACSLIQANLPSAYEGKKNWDHRKRVYAGIDIDLDHGKIKTHRKYREVRHGNWLRYRIDLKDPSDPQHLQFTVHSVQPLDDGRMQVDLQIDSMVDIEVQQQRWNLGLQAYSITGRGHARLRLRLLADVGAYFDSTKIPPDVVLDPVVRQTELQLIDLELDKIGILGSDIAEEIGDAIERAVSEDYIPKQQEKLTNKLNQQIERERSKLRVSTSDWLARYLKPKPAAP